ncbi:MAG: SMC family ATPase [Pyrinomonadaceae bacterium]
MHISKVELENIKSHASSVFEFEKGTTAITGENGAGKTSIIEAIAWVLFDLLDYKKDDFVRRGASKGSVSVTFESGLDEREYVVYRDTGTSYHVTDPRLGVRIANKKEEVFRCLWQHLGLEPGTDLKSLFRQAIGVPQGTLTAIFLEGSTDRKIAFDRLLKVEEYRQAAEKLRDTARFLDNSVRDIRETIARTEGELSRADAAEAEHRLAAETVAALTTESEDLQASLATRQSRVNQLDLQAGEVASAKNAYDAARITADSAAAALKQAEELLARAVEATEIIAVAKPAYTEHLQALDDLTRLEATRAERDLVREAVAKDKLGLASVDAERRRLDKEIESIAAARAEIESLKQLVPRQDQLESEIQRLQENVAVAKDSTKRLAERKERRDRLRRAFSDNRDALIIAREKAGIAAELAVLENRYGELTNSLATFQANLERDEKFQSEIKNGHGLCPILSGKCLNLADGETLESFVSNQFLEIRGQIGVAERERIEVTGRVAIAREAAKAAAAIDSLLHRADELKAEGITVNAEIERLDRQAADLADAERSLSENQTELAKLENPKGRIKLLERHVQGEDTARQSLAAVDIRAVELNRRVDESTRQLSRFAGLDAEWSRAIGKRDTTRDAHMKFVAHERDAAQREMRQKEEESAAAKLQGSVSVAADAQKLVEAANEDYNEARHKAERDELLAAERLYASTRARLAIAAERHAQLTVELDRFAELRTSLIWEFAEKDRVESVAETTAFIRDTLKEAAPRVARNYVHHVSIEANTLFREITGRAEQSLRWAEDYSIVLEENGYERPFISLSGGEQMSAALAIRLALLKQLSDIRIAFFDEPTSNMDVDRRENFAMQMGRISHFDQLFVISHDDTFDNYVDHVITLD